MTFKLLLIFFLLFMFFRFVGRIFLPLAMFRQAFKNAQHQSGFTGASSKGRTSPSKNRKKDFSAIEEAEFEEITPTKNPKDRSQESS
jgi:hypothetical protein